MTSQIKQEILDALQQRGIILGTETITISLTTINCKRAVLTQLRTLERDGFLVVIPSRGGRGKKTVYKRNPNQPGQPRRKRGGTR